MSDSQDRRYNSLPDLHDSSLPAREDTFPYEEGKRGKSRSGNRELPAPQFTQPAYVKDTGERVTMEKKDVPTKEGNLKFADDPSFGEY